MTKRDYKNEPYPTWARFVDGELDLQTAFWGILTKCVCILNALSMLGILYAEIS